jgi:hypothetical protein
VAIELTFQVQDMNHSVVRTFSDDDGEPFLKVCRQFAGVGVRYVDFIWPYQDAMLNEFQLRAWLEDFPKALHGPDLSAEQRRCAERVLVAAEEAVDMSGYIFIQG